MFFPALLPNDIVKDGRRPWPAMDDLIRGSMTLKLSPLSNQLRLSASVDITCPLTDRHKTTEDGTMMKFAEVYTKNQQ